jgi:hypothetical protein
MGVTRLSALARLGEAERLLKEGELEMSERRRAADLAVLARHIEVTQDRQEETNWSVFSRSSMRQTPRSWRGKQPFQAT